MLLASLICKDVIYIRSKKAYLNSICTKLCLKYSSLEPLYNGIGMQASTHRHHHSFLIKINNWCGSTVMEHLRKDYFVIT